MATGRPIGGSGAGGRVAGRRRRAATVAVVAAMATVGCVVAGCAADSDPPPEVTSALPDGIVEGVCGWGGCSLKEAPASAVAQVSAAEALVVAQGSEAGQRRPDWVGLVLYRGPGTQAVDAQGYEYGPVRERLMYLFVFEGLELYPLGGGYRPGATTTRDPASAHHELVVLVDATTGEFISASTFR